MNYFQEYINEKVFQLRVLTQAQWDYLKYSQISAWLEDNFKNDFEGKYYATKILLHTVYYSKQDIERLLNFGLNEKIYGEIIKNELIAKNDIYLPHSEAEAQVLKLKQSSFFVPLLDSDKPSESGNIVIGDLVHKLSISEDQVAFHWKVSEESLKKFKLLIFVDDCVGSGSQLKRFWNSEKIQTIKDICKKYDIPIYYLVLIGYDKNLEIISKEKEIEGIRVIICDILTDRNRVFSDDNIIWDKTNGEREKALEYFEKLMKEKGVRFLGYKKLDFAVVLHDRLPNWSLPIFWKEMVGWKCLLRRKTTI
jgi:hypothetical protein